MSIAEMSRVFKVNLKKVKSGKLVLLAIADNADDDGYAFPGMKAIGDKSDMTERNAKRVVHNLAEAGQLYIATSKGRGNTNAYVILALLSRSEMIQRLVKTLEMTTEQASIIASDVIEKRDKLSLLKKVTKSTENVTNFALKRDIAMSPKPSVTIIEPPEEESRTLAQETQIDSRTQTDSSSSDLADLIKVYEQNINMITPAIVLGSPGVMGLQEAIDTYPVFWITEAIQLSAVRNKRSWGYALGILKRWKDNGKDTPVKTGNGHGAGEHPQPTRYQLIRSRTDCPKCSGGWISTPDGMERCTCWQRVPVAEGA